MFTNVASILNVLVPTLLSGIIAFITCKWQLSKEKLSSEEARLNEQLFNILRIQIEYPYLENVHFTNNWNRKKAKKELDYQRYDSYCCILFNFMEQIYKLYNGNKDKIDNFFTVSEEVRIHKIWWREPLNPRDNIEGYDQQYRCYINSIIEKETK